MLKLEEKEEKPKKSQKMLLLKHHQNSQKCEKLCLLLSTHNALKNKAFINSVAGTMSATSGNEPASAYTSFPVSSEAALSRTALRNESVRIRGISPSFRRRHSNSKQLLSTPLAALRLQRDFVWSAAALMAATSSASLQSPLRGTSSGEQSVAKSFSEVAEGSDVRYFESSSPWDEDEWSFSWVFCFMMGFEDFSNVFILFVFVHRFLWIFVFERLIFCIFLLGFDSFFCWSGFFYTFF